MPRRNFLAVGVAILLFAGPAQAATGLDGATMSWPWALPFLGILLSIVTGPLLFRKFWHHNYGKIAFAWAALAIVPIAIFYGFEAAVAAFTHAMLAEYLSFIVLLFTLYTVAGGILITGNLRGTPGTNTALLAFGTLIASFVGTTGAAMMLIRPLLRANEKRKQNVHTVVFFIILVANVGGALTPLGDPPLFLGFLRGIDFFWTARNLWLQTVIVAVPLLALFLVVDTWFYRREQPERTRREVRIRVRGGVNLVLIALVIVSILVSAAWKPELGFTVLGTRVELQNIMRDGALIGIAFLSLWLTSDEHRQANGFTWEPIREVAKLFAGIFVAIIPVLAMLHAGRNGLFSFLLQAITDANDQPRDIAYFWLTGVLSAFLDNAPTYVVFFELAGGDPKQLMGPLAGTLAAISMGAVYMGALTYIGNAPNFMVYAIAEEQGVKMPSFFGYLLWASLVLIPFLLLISLLPVPPL